MYTINLYISTCICVWFSLSFVDLVLARWVDEGAECGYHLTLWHQFIYRKVCSVVDLGVVYIFVVLSYVPDSEILHKIDEFLRIFFITISICSVLFIFILYKIFWIIIFNQIFNINALLLFAEVLLCFYFIFYIHTINVFF